MDVEGHANKEVLEVLDQELMASIRHHLRECAEDACLKVDLLISSALRQLPPDIRAMPVREAFNLCANEADVARGSELVSLSNGTGFGTKPIPGLTGLSGLSKFSAGASAARTIPAIGTAGQPDVGLYTIERLSQGLEYLNELSGQIEHASTGFETMSREQRNSIVQELTQELSQIRPKQTPTVGGA